MNKNIFKIIFGLVPAMAMSSVGANIDLFFDPLVRFQQFQCLPCGCKYEKEGRMRNFDFPGLSIGSYSFKLEDKKLNLEKEELLSIFDYSTLNADVISVIGEFIGKEQLKFRYENREFTY